MMVEEKRTLLQRLKHWLFGKKEASRADQKERRDEISTFLEEHAEGEEDRVAAAQEKRRSATDEAK